MARLESSIERAVVKYAKERGVLVRKLNGEGERGWPDRMFLYCGRVWFAEFKQLGKKPTPVQWRMIRRLEAEGFWVSVVDDVEEGKGWVDHLIDS